MKSIGHVYMANILLKEAKSGFLKLNGVKYALPTQVKAALCECPSYFRAGAIGPDFFPDLLIGQSDIHPVESGAFLNHMYDSLCKINPNSVEYLRSFAFYLGFTMHYSCDMFSHCYINKHAGGFFPDFAEMLTDSKKMGVALRHIILEAYLDSKVLAQDIKIDVPYDYLKTCFVVSGSWDRIKNNAAFKKTEVGKNSLEIPRILYENYQDCSEKGLTATADKKNEFIDKWLKLWHSFAQNELKSESSKTSIEDYVDEILDVVEHTKFSKQDKDKVKVFMVAVKSYAMFRDAKKVYDVKKKIEVLINPLGVLVDSVINAIGLLDPVKIGGKVVGLVFFRNILKNLYECCFGEQPSKLPRTKAGCIKEIKNVLQTFLKHPAEVMNNNFLFEEMRKNYQCEKLTDYFDKEWGNFGKNFDCESQTFDVFRKCLNMGKLCLIGNKHLTRIAKEYKANTHDYASFFADGKLSNYVSRLIVVAKVADVRKAGTNGDVYLKINTKYTSVMHPLDKRHFNNFERGDINYFEIDVNPIDVEELVSFEISNSAGLDRLSLEKLYVYDEDTYIPLAEGTNSGEIKKDKNWTIPVSKTLSREFERFNLQSVPKYKLFKLEVSGSCVSGTGCNTYLSMYSGKRREFRGLLHQKYLDTNKSFNFVLSLDCPFDVENLDRFEIENFAITKTGGLTFSSIVVKDSATGIVLASQSSKTSAIYKENFLHLRVGNDIKRLLNEYKKKLGKGA